MSDCCCPPNSPSRRRFYDQEWREVTFVFRAEEPFRHFTFGLFESEPSVRREETGSRDMAYYFVDHFIAPYLPELAIEEEQGVQPRPEETELEGCSFPMRSPQMEMH